MINPILYQDAINKYHDIQKDYNIVKNRVASDEKETNITFGALPVYGKVYDLPQQLSHGDYGSSAMLSTLAAINAPEEIDDLMSALAQIKSKFSKKFVYEKPYDNRVAQHPFSFFRNSALRKYMNPESPLCPFPALAEWLVDKDKSIYATKLGKYIRNKLNIVTDDIESKVESIYSTDKDKVYVIAKKINTDNFFKDIAARSMLRTTKIGALALGSIEAVQAKNKIDNGESPLKAVGSAVLNTGATLAGAGVLGAIGAKYGGAAGSFIGTGGGAVLGALTSRALA